MICETINRIMGTHYFMKYNDIAKVLTIYEPISVEDIVKLKKIRKKLWAEIKEIRVKG